MTDFKTWLAGALAWLAVTVPALAQQEGQQVPTDTAIPSLMFFTLGIALLVGIGAFLYFLRKRSNREATERGLGLEDNPRR